MMIIVTVKTGRDKLDLTVHGRGQLLHLIGILENSRNVDSYKISLSEGILVENLYTDFGIGECSKFCTAFNWKEV
jgi:hypothetical protein